MKDLASRIALITGASSGIGLATAKTLAQEGMTVILVARSIEPLELAAQRLRSDGTTVKAIPTDVTNLQQIQAMVESVIVEFGRIDVLVNCAGTESIRAFHQIDHADIEQTIRLNLTATIHLTRAVIPHMLMSGQGHIVTISSIAGKLGPAFAAAYAASKAGQIAFTQSLRSEYHQAGISASVICPGITRDGGLFERLRNELDFTSPPQLGWTSSQVVARAVVQSIRNDRAEVIVNTLPLRPIFALSQLFPRLAGWLATTASRHHFRRVAFERDNRQRRAEIRQKARDAARAA